MKALMTESPYQQLNTLTEQSRRGKSNPNAQWNRIFGESFSQSLISHLVKYFFTYSLFKSVLKKSTTNELRSLDNWFSTLEYHEAGAFGQLDPAKIIKTKWIYPCSQYQDVLSVDLN